ncbi:hypothetical protein MVES_000539 [Malassezia vespertilionis]|uniref:P-loop containing nucleoside triphosphate hydrolase protein n=1 Tax=Malassezia vespertilionis TaxID=2020962 RepID=A0A2N1JGX4_9BASI|nr:hypothetical protein MVES_000539 [Malassezia vespertilionis]
MLPHFVVGISILVLVIKRLQLHMRHDVEVLLDAIQEYSDQSPLDPDRKPSAAQRVFETENAVLIDTALSIKEDLTSKETMNSLNGMRERKRAFDLLFSAILCLSHALGSLLLPQAEWEQHWCLLWVYATTLAVYSYRTGTRISISMTMISTVYFLVSLSNLRTVILSFDSYAVAVLTAGQTCLASFMFYLSVFTPLSLDPPQGLNILRHGFRKRKRYGEFRTTVPTPRHAREGMDLGEPLPNLSRDTAPSPPPIEQHASILSRCTWTFVQPFILKHYKEPITFSAIPELLLGDRAAPVIAMFRAQDTNPGKTPVLPTKPIWRRLVVNFSPYITYQMVCAMFDAIINVAPVYFLQRLLSFFSERAKGGSLPLHMGIMFALFGFISQFFYSVFQSQSLMTGRHICLQLRAVLTFEILSKTMRRSTNVPISPEERRNQAELLEGHDDNASASDGQVTNLVSVDVSKVAEFAAYSHFLFPQEPIMVTLGSVYLVNLLGKSAAVGLVLLVIALPIQAYIARLLVAVQTRLLRATDARLNLAGEVLACIKTVKFFAWEKPFERRMTDTRARELRLLRVHFLLTVIEQVLFVATPMLVAIATFGAHTLIFHRELDASTAFTALALFNVLKSPLTEIPFMIHWFLGCIVSIRRISKYLAQPDTEKYEQLLDDEPEEAASVPAPRKWIGFRKAVFSFSAKDKDEPDQFFLHDLNCTFPTEKLSIVSGPVGSGKTSLLLALLGEMHRISGKTIMPCAIARSLVPHDPRTGLAETVAYCSQSPWLLGTTVRQNILFGAKYDEERYQQVLDACALGPDLEILEYHDETEVGEKGTALSGGQKARIALARAFYSNAKYLLVDDALSAVDAQTARHLAEKCFAGPLAKNRTIVLITHAMSLMLPLASHAVCFDEGRITGEGAPTDLVSKGLIDLSVASDELRDKRSASVSAEPHASEDEDLRVQRKEKMEERRARKAFSQQNEEKILRKKSSFSLYWLYMGAVSKYTSLAVLFCIRAADIGSSDWLREWAGSYEALSVVHTMASWSNALNTAPISDDTERTMYYMKGYALFLCAYIALTFLCNAVQYTGSLNASAQLYSKFIHSLLLAKPQFYDKTPIGRVTNRLSRDVEEVDQELSPVMQQTFSNLVALVAIIVVICWATPSFLFVLVFILALYAAIGTLYLASSRDLKRVESVQRSPLYTLVGETMSGMVTIRAYSDGERVMRQCLSLVDQWNRAFIMLWYENRWLSMCTDLTGAGVTFIASFLLLVGTADAALAGFTLSYAISLVEVVLWLVRLYSAMEIDMNSVERIGEYIDIDAENQGGEVPPAHWPTDKGPVQVKNLSVRYGPEFPFALNDVSFTIQPGEKIGIVGRTGSGKSTLSLSFFRFLEAEKGSIFIDGIDISTITLESLRKRLTIIPQDSQLFQGTIRANLDPFDKFEDGEMWFALQCCQMASGVLQDVFTPDGSSVVKSLDANVGQGGSNFSAGQRQLLSLARGLLKMRESRLLILDESTANLDSETDALIQRTIREQIAPGATIITVAHRLKTIIDYDKVLVLGKGKVLEYGTPSALIAEASSAFYELCQQSGNFDDLVSAANAHAHAQ